MAYFETKVLDNQIKALPTIKAISNTPIATFDTDIADRLVNLNVAVTATQSGSGTPSPSNPRNISGVSSITIGNGLNVLEITAVSRTHNNLVYTVNDDGTITVSGTNTAISYLVLTNSTNSLEPTETTNLYNGDFVCFDSGITQPLTIRYTNGVYKATENGKPFTLAADVALVYIQFTAGTHNETIVPKVYRGTTHKINFGQTVYGGSLDVLTGKLTITHGYFDLGELNWGKLSGVTGAFYSIQPTAYAPRYDNDYVANAICEQYKVVSRNNLPNNDLSFSISYSDQIYVTVKDERYSTSEAFTTAVSGIKLVYELATPTVLQLSSEEVASIVGNNNIYADTGNVTELEYKITVGLAIS